MDTGYNFMPAKHTKHAEKKSLHDNKLFRKVLICLSPSFPFKVDNKALVESGMHEAAEK